MRPLHLAVLLMAMVETSGCGSKSPAPSADVKPPETDKSIELSAESQNIAGVEVTPAAMRAIQESVTVPGTVVSTSKGRAVVTPPVSGRVIGISIQLGQAVRQGEPLFTLESSELAQSWLSIAESQRSRDALSAQLSEAISEAKVATAKVQSAQVSLGRQKEFAKAGAFSQAPLQQAQRELNDAQSELLDAQRQLDFHAVQLQRDERLFKEGLVAKTELEAARLDVQIDQNRILKGKASVGIAKATYDREKLIAQKGLLNLREIQTAEAEVRSSQLELDRSDIKTRSARAALANSEKAIRNARTSYQTFASGGRASGGQVVVLAPMSGFIAKLDVSKGQAVDRTQSLMEVENSSTLWATANVQEKDVGKVSVGVACVVTSSALEGRTFEAVVQVVGSRLDPKTRTVPVECLITASNGALKPGMFVTVRIGLSRSRVAVAVPIKAVVKDGDKNVVFVKEGSKYERREVTLGTSDGSYVEILDGIKEKESVAVDGTFVLTSESKKDELKGGD